MLQCAQTKPLSTLLPSLLPLLHIYKAIITPYCETPNFIFFSVLNKPPQVDDSPRPPRHMSGLNNTPPLEKRAAVKYRKLRGVVVLFDRVIHPSSPRSHPLFENRLTNVWCQRYTRALFILPFIIGDKTAFRVISRRLYRFVCNGTVYPIDCWRRIDGIQTLYWAVAEGRVPLRSTGVLNLSGAIATGWEGGGWDVGEEWRGVRWGGIGNQSTVVGETSLIPSPRGGYIYIDISGKWELGGGKARRTIYLSLRSTVLCSVKTCQWVWEKSVPCHSGQSGRLDLAYHYTLLVNE